jgi:hypothetical protein
MRPFRIAIYVSILCLLWSRPGLSEHDHSNSESGHYYGSPNSWYLPAAIVIENQPNGGNDSNRVSSQGNKNSQESPQAWMFKAELMIVWVTGIYTIVSTIALILLGIQIRHGKVTTQRQLRAYVVPEKGSIVNVADVVPDPPELEQHARVVNPNIGPLATIGIKNVGQSPSFDVRHTTTIYVRAYTNPPATLKKLPDEGEPSTMILGPQIGASMDIWLYNPLTPLEVDNLKAGLAVIYVVGVIEYTDIFGVGHITHYQMEHHSLHGKIGWSTKLVFSPNGNWGD